MKQLIKNVVSVHGAFADGSGSQSEFEAMRRPHKKVILKQCACALQSSAYSGLAQQ